MRARPDQVGDGKLDSKFAVGQIESRYDPGEDGPLGELAEQRSGSLVAHGRSQQGQNGCTAHRIAPDREERADSPLTDAVLVAVRISPAISAGRTASPSPRRTAAPCCRSSGGSAPGPRRPDPRWRGSTPVVRALGELGPRGREDLAAGVGPAGTPPGPAASASRSCRLCPRKRPRSRHDHGKVHGTDPRSTCSAVPSGRQRRPCRPARRPG